MSLISQSTCPHVLTKHTINYTDRLTSYTCTPKRIGKEDIHTKLILSHISAVRQTECGKNFRAKTILSQHECSHRREDICVNRIERRNTINSLFQCDSQGQGLG